MKKIAIVLITFFTCQNYIYSQSINGLEVKDIDVNYMRIYGRSNFMGTKMVVRFEFGQRIGFDHNNKNIRDKNGKIIKFNTMIDAMNFISSYGYRLIQTYMTAQGRRTIYYHYIVEKIGLIDNKGVNKYVNAQNRSYSKTYGTEGDWKEYKEQKEKKKEDWKENRENKNESNPPLKKEQSKKEEPKPKKAKSNSFLDKLSNGVSKNKTTSTTETKVKETEKKATTEVIKCSACQGLGTTTTHCHTDNCDDGFVTKTCSSCQGKYKEGKDLCYKCDGEGCDYCDYDGTACDACKSGKKNGKHLTCNGTGKTQQTCSECKGKGKVIK